ncbi:hypothetical protein BGZ63DRAFT_429079 [Mariannaea sp. PMI_226]|nr:hypothetical protein BGZ63DRAFT_429079 [Mariannaea sp. PMI_226]
MASFMLPSTPVRSSVASEFLLVSPLVASSTSPSPRSRKRQVTPSFEASSSKKIAVIVPAADLDPSQGTLLRPVGTSPLAWPTAAQEARIDARQPFLPNPLRLPQADANQSPQSPPISQNPLRPALQVPHWQILPKARHLILPFNLRENRDAWDKRENRDMLMNIFPNTTGVAIDGTFLFIHVSEKPSKPWPKTVAGLPLYLVPGPGPDYDPIPMGLPVNPRNGRIAGDIDGRDMEVWTPLFEAIRDHFLDLQISITQVMYWGNSVLIILEHRDTDMAKLPWRAAGIPCRYLHDDEMGRPRLPQSRRQSDPTPGNPDQNQYHTLQPGVRVTSNFFPDECEVFQATTAGVLVKDAAGNELMTVAGHRFPSKCGPVVFHALPSTGRKIGEIIYEVSHTDVALVKLEWRERFANVTFESADLFAEPVRLKRLLRPRDLRRGDTVYLDSPDTGCIDGTLMAEAYQRVPTDDPNEPMQNWVFTTWYYMGQDLGESLPPGMCGSPIWTQEGDVIGFFRYAAEGGKMQDWCCGIAANELIDRGFTLVDTSGRE